MKRGLLFILSIIAVASLALAGCAQPAGQGTGGAAAGTGTEEVTEAATEAATEPEPETEEIEAYLSPEVKELRDKMLDFAEEMDGIEGFDEEAYIDNFYSVYKKLKKVQKWEDMWDFFPSMCGYFDYTCDVGTYGGSIAENGWAALEYLYRGDVKNYRKWLKAVKDDCLVVKEPEPTPAEYKQSCASIDYKTLARNPDKYEGQKVTFTGQVVQVMEGEGITAYRINVTPDEWGYYDDTVYVTYSGDLSEGRILDDDIVNFWGESTGLYSYESVLHEEITIPSVEAKYIELVQ